MNCNNTHGVSPTQVYNDEKSRETHVRDDTVEDAFLVPKPMLAGRELAEVARGLGHDVVVEFEHCRRHGWLSTVAADTTIGGGSSLTDTTFGLIVDCNIELKQRAVNDIRMGRYSG